MFPSWNLNYTAHSFRVDVLVLVPVTRMTFLLFNGETQVRNSIKKRVNMSNAKQQEGISASDHAIIPERGQL